MGLEPTWLVFLRHPVYTTNLEICSVIFCTLIGDTLLLYETNWRLDNYSAVDIMCLNYTPALCQKCRGQSLLIYSSVPLSYLRLFTIFFYNLERLKHSAFGRQQRQRKTLHKPASFDMFWRHSANSIERIVFYFNSISDELSSVESLVFEIDNFPGVLAH